MKEFACAAVVPSCTATFQAESEDEILAQAADHAREEHGMEEIPPAVVEQIRSNIREPA
jgi:predicted small metal-binding protein